jgi:hypothetical protein
MFTFHRPLPLRRCQSSKPILGRSLGAIRVNTAVGYKPSGSRDHLLKGMRIFCVCADTLCSNHADPHWL